MKLWIQPGENNCWQWIRRFILFNGKRHPEELGAGEIEAFLTYPATERRVAASTNNQALSALLLLYRKVLILTCRGWIPSQRS